MPCRACASAQPDRHGRPHNMRRVLRRLLHSLFLLLGASLLSLWLVDLAPGDFFDEMRLNPRISTGTVTQIRSQRGLSQPFLTRYWRWLKSVFRGDWGISLTYDSPAAPILRYRALNTLLLTTGATLLAWTVALPIGVVAACRPGKLLDFFADMTVSVLLPIPDLVLSLLLLLLAVRTGWFPAGGMASPGLVHKGSLIRHLFLPALCLAAGLLPVLLAHVRSAVAEALRTPYVSAARGLGIPSRRVLLKYALPIAANPLISLFGLSLGALISSSVLVESVFSWPGLGQLGVQAILSKDSPLIIDTTLLATVFLISGNLLADLLLYATDPRIRAE